uniref:Uncharacterized protein n=1 Tax=Macaca fascicularis TaxID=9541 RepID=Q2PG50_MACFA|nr:hypothetical protein [Macaca fascicularis]
MLNSKFLKPPGLYRSVCSVHLRRSAVGGPFCECSPVSLGSGWHGRLRVCPPRPSVYLRE